MVLNTNSQHVVMLRQSRKIPNEASGDQLVAGPVHVYLLIPSVSKITIPPLLAFFPFGVDFLHCSCCLAVAFSSSSFLLLAGKLRAQRQMDRIMELECQNLVGSHHKRPLPCLSKEKPRGTRGTRSLLVCGRRILVRYYQRPGQHPLASNSHWI
jgi:hypothetical protein